VAVGDAITLFSAELVGSNKLLRLLTGVNRNLKGGRLRDAWEELTEMINIEARGNAPYSEGDLLISIEDEVLVSDDVITGVVFSDVLYAPFQERGTDVYFPNVDALEDWARLHGKTAWSVALSILGRGVPARKYFELTLVENEDEIVRLVGGVVAEILEREY